PAADPAPEARLADSEPSSRLSTGAALGVWREGEGAGRAACDPLGHPPPPLTQESSAGRPPADLLLRDLRDALHVSHPAPGAAEGPGQRLGLFGFFLQTFFLDSSVTRCGMRRRGSVGTGPAGRPT